MPTPSVMPGRRTRRAESKTQFGEAELGGFLHSRKPPSIFIFPEQSPALSPSRLLPNLALIQPTAMKSDGLWPSRMVLPTVYIASS